jgi:glycine cleavage system aminomethyltransferase T
VRTAVGIADVSTFGKLEIFGPDAIEFLERVYANRFRSLTVGRCRYGIMLREDGMVFDDGTTTRLGEQHFI